MAEYDFIITCIPKIWESITVIITGIPKICQSITLL